jgi:hypothetical protein
VTPFNFSRRLVARDSPSSVLVPISPTTIRVGSLLQPAPMDDITGRLWSWQYFSSSTLVSILSMASTTKSGFRPSSQGPSNLSALSPSNFSTQRSNPTHGVMAISLLRRHCTLLNPTSASVATACLLSELSVTWSKSTNRIRPTPERARAEAQWDPTPPQPTTTTNEDRSFSRPSGVRKTLFRASCSRISSSSKSPFNARRARSALRASSLSAFVRGTWSRLAGVFAEEEASSSFWDMDDRLGFEARFSSMCWRPSTAAATTAPEMTAVAASWTLGLDVKEAMAMLRDRGPLV